MRSWSGFAAAAALVAVVAGCAEDGASTEEMDGDAAAAFAGCPESIPELAVGLTARGEHGRIDASLLDASRLPARKYRNEWTLLLSDAAATPLDDAEITQLSTFMPVHGHYGRPDPTVMALEEPGQVQAELHFTMRGPWEVRIEASSESAGDDSIVFEVCVAE